MSQALEDYFATQKALRVTFHQMAIAVHRLEIAELGLDTDSGVPALMEAQAAFDLAARDHARAVEGLPIDRKPRGWNEGDPR